jgi:hypothetical protein
MGVMADQELIAFLRQRLSALQIAVLDYEECLEQTTPERDAEVRKALDGYSAAQAETIHAVVMRALMGETNEKRAAAWAKVREASTMTFQEAIQADAEISEENRAYWLNEGVVTAHVNREVSMDDQTGEALDDIIAAAARRLKRTE